MAMKHFLLAISLISAQVCFAADIFCDTGKPHPIELKLEKHIHDTALDNTVWSALSEAHDQWDKQLNRIYRELMAELKPDDQAPLKESQRSWLAYRDRQIDLWNSNALYGDSGSMGRISVIDLHRDMLSQRVCELMRYKNIAYTGAGS